MKLKEGVVLFHGSPHAPKIDAIRGPAWFSTALRTAVWYAGTFQEDRLDMSKLKPGVIVYEVTKPVSLYRLPKEAEDLDAVLYSLLVKKTGLLEWEDWSLLDATGLLGLGWSEETWDLDEVRDTFPDQGERIDRMEQLGLTGVVGAIKAICKADPSFHGWTFDRGRDWEVMLCEPLRWLRRVDLWDVVQNPDAPWPYGARKRKRLAPEEQGGWKAVPSSRRVAARYTTR